MRNLKFPEIDKKIQQSVYGAWGGSNSNEPAPIDGGWLNNVNVGPSGGGSGGSGSWDYGDNGSYDNGGYWGDPGGSGGGGTTHDFGDYFISPDYLLHVAQGHANSDELWDVDSKVRAAVNATGLGAGFTGTAMDGLAAITKELGFTVKTFGKTATGIGVAGVAIGTIETYIAITEAVNGEDPWTDADTLNAMATVLGAAALFPGPHSIICGGLSIAIGLVGTAYSN